MATRRSTRWLFNWYTHLSILLAISALLNASCFAQDSSIQTITRLLQKGSYQQAEQQCELTLDKHPRNYQLWTLRALAYSGLHKQAAALASYTEALKLAPHYLPALEGAAGIMYLQGRAQAIPLLNDILASVPEDPTANAMLAVMEFQRNHCKEAIPHFRDSVAILSSQPAAYNDFGMCLYKLGRYQEASAVFSNVLALQPNNRSVRHNLALAYWIEKKDRNALDILDPTLQSGTPDVADLSLASEIEEDEGNTQKAVSLLRQAIIDDPLQTDLYLQFATLSFMHKSFKVGIDMLTAGLSQMPKSARLYLARGILYIQSSDYTQGVGDLETAHTLDPSLSLTNSAEGLLESQRHHLKQAIAHFREAIRNNPKDAYSHYLLAEALMSQGGPPNSKNIVAARNSLELAISLDPKLVKARDLLATLDLEYGSVRPAIKESRAALKLDPSDQAALFHLIIALKKTRQTSEIPALVKRLGYLKETSREMKSHSTLLKLEESTGPSASP